MHILLYAFFLCIKEQIIIKNRFSTLNKEGKMLKDVIWYLPENIKNIINEYIENKNISNFIEEIRMRSNGNLSIKNGQEIISIYDKISKNDIQETFENICENSVYSYTKQISEGFITIKGGNRVGIVGTAVIENDKVININDISSLNFRIAKEIKDVSVPILKFILDVKNNTIYNTLIISAPRMWKNNTFKRYSKKNI